MEMQMLLIRASTERGCSACTIRRGEEEEEEAEDAGQTIKKSPFQDKDEFLNTAAPKIHKSCKEICD